MFSGLQTYKVIVQLFIELLVSIQNAMYAIYQCTVAYCQYF